jgi:hypothetical protein
MAVIDDPTAEVRPRADETRAGSVPSYDRSPRPRERRVERVTRPLVGVNGGGVPDARLSVGVRALYGALIFILVGYGLSLIIRGQDGVSPTWLDGWGVAAFELLASVLVVARGLSRPADRKYTVWLGLGCCVWAIGDFAMTYETLNGVTPATISAANYLWAGFFPLAYVGVMVLIQRDVRRLTALPCARGQPITLPLVTASLSPRASNSSGFGMMMV